MSSPRDDRSSTSTELEQAQTQTTEPHDVLGPATGIRDALMNTCDQHHGFVGLEQEIRRRQEVESTLRDSDARQPALRLSGRVLTLTKRRRTFEDGWPKEAGMQPHAGFPRAAVASSVGDERRAV